MATFSPTPRLIVLTSGDGRYMQALIDRCGHPVCLYSHIIHVISNRKAAHGLTLAADAGIPTTYLNLLPYKQQHKDDVASAREAYDADLAALILAQSPDLVVCEGWTHILSAVALRPLAAARVGIVNMCYLMSGHYYPDSALDRCFEALKKGGKITRMHIILQRVSEEVNRGEVIVQRSHRVFPYMDWRTFETISTKVGRNVIIAGTKAALRRQREEREAAGLVWSVTAPEYPSIDPNSLSF